eukprot:GEMP01089501.1.p1 GENE.GEMP01089501.1~~GEMP01089501.1.p1  ORF type:complete len:267 (+),score=48.69 GEMP01089501.1:118-918(+)
MRRKKTFLNSCVGETKNAPHRSASTGRCGYQTEIIWSAARGKRKMSHIEVHPLADVLEERKRSVNLGITTISMSEKKAERLLVGGLTAFVILNATMIPFALPKFTRFLGAPYLPTKRRVVDAMFDSLKGHIGPLEGLKLVDIGSGDGRIILKASVDHAMRAKGYEINPYLALVSKFRCMRAPSAQTLWKNAWDSQKDLADADVVTLYGRPGDKLMERLAVYLDKSTKPDCIVVSNRFDLPHWERRLVEDREGLKVYHKNFLTKTRA